MALVKYFFGTEAEILALEPTDSNWVNQAFYYPTDQDYFYQAYNGEMKLYGSGESSGIGIRLNGSNIGGVKSIIEDTDILEIPENWDYNTFSLLVNGTINCDGQINILEYGTS